jgi:glycosyltransferase involved in cell wall biosynthesis
VRHDIGGAHGRGKKLLRLIRSWRQGLPYIVSNYRNPAYVAVLRKQIAAERYDAVLVESTPLSYLFSDVPELSDSVPVIFRAHDMLSETIDKFGEGEGMRPSAVVARVEAARTRRFERRVWAQSTVIAPVTRRLCHLIASALPTNLPARIVYLPVVSERRDRIRPGVSGGNPVVLYVGTVHYPPNFQGLEWFLEKVWPSVLKEVPSARLRIIGKGGALLRSEDPTVEVLDYVEDLDEHYAAADALVVPLFSGSGIRLKILEAFSHSVPVVSTTEGYLGLDIVAGDHLLAADTREDFAAAVLSLLSSASLRDRLRHSSAQFLEEYHGAALMADAGAQLKAAIQPGTSKFEVQAS